MSNINLLPWRQHLKKQQKKQFMRQVSWVCVFTLVAIAGAYGYVRQQAHVQQQRNLQLQQASLQLDDTLHTIELLRQQRRQLQARGNFIEQFQSQRHIPVQLFNQLPTWIPTAVYLDRIYLAEHGLEINGKTTAYSQLAQMVQQIESAGWLTQPRLQVVAVPNAPLSSANQFSLQFSHKAP
ncbi:PilN domain-containing protein [Oceanisphaera ostreae]|uniref:PilN domain-containing protein n=1 Tax=Oceanisphaera ostreae TaxID=914151 RepID=A0ABW3KJ70_9GAMM